MTFIRFTQMITLAAVLAGCGEAAPPPGPAQPMTPEDFRRELVGLPLCATPKNGPLAGKHICTVHLADGTAILAGSGVLARGIWDSDGKRICRRDAVDTVDRRRCLDYERLGNNRYRNGDGVEFCIGPCP
jgi:hypothetical protein